MITIVETIKDSDGNVTYEKHSDGYFEKNTYKDGKLIRSESHYTNGIVEVEQYKED